MKIKFVSMYDGASKKKFKAYYRNCSSCGRMIDDDDYWRYDGKCYYCYYC